MKKILYILLSLSIISCSPIRHFNLTGIPTIEEFDFNRFRENGIKVFSENYDFDKYYEVGVYKVIYTSDMKIIGINEKVPGGYYIMYELNSIKICREKKDISVNNIYGYVIKLVEEKGDAILNIEIEENPILVYEYNGPSNKIYSNEITFKFTILKLKK